MSELLICRACLACNVPVYNILHTRYQHALERITSISVAESSKPHALCAPCLETLDKCCKLQEKSAVAEGFLSWLLQQNKLTEEAIKSIDRQQYKLADFLPNFTTLVPMKASEKVQTMENIMIKIEPFDTQTQDSTDVPEQEKDVATKEPPNHKIAIETVKVEETPYIQIDVGKSSAFKSEVDEHSNDADPLDDGLVQIELEMQQTEYNAILESKNRIKEDIENARALKDGTIVKKSSKPESKTDVKDYLKKFTIDNRRLKKVSCGKCETKCKHIPLEKPSQKQTIDESFSCSECDYKTSSRKNLTYHTKKHTDNLVICAICGYKCATKSRLVSHIRIHTKERPYQCKACGKKFSEVGTMRKHFNYLHNRIKAFKCMWCDYGAATKSHLDRHVQRHTGDKRFKCELCDYACVQKWDLKRHVKTHENERMRYKRVAPVIVRIVSMAEQK